MDVRQDWSSKSDEELVRLTLQNKENYRFLVERYQAKLQRFLAGLTRLDTMEYEDILQNAFLKVYINLNDYDLSLKFSSWLYRIVHNEMIDYIRHKKAKTETVSLDQEDDNTLKLIDILSDETDIPKETDRTLLAKQMEKIVSSLPLEYREVVLLKYYEDRDYQEISDILKKPMGTIATLLNRAKFMLKQKITVLFQDSHPL